VLSSKTLRLNLDSADVDGQTLAHRILAEVECIQTGQRWTFIILDELLDFLRQWVEQSEIGGRSVGE
jgi:hypothetical protein